jgi:predicted RNA-binding Zn-ribbon protein involved in translation (DUF1610 family)
MDNKYWRSENELDDGIDGVKRPIPNEVRKQFNLTETQIKKEQLDFTNYFYCPVCGKITLIKDAVIRRYTLNKSLGLRNAAMPGWMKISASVDYCYIRVCPQCEAKPLSDDAFVRACDGNAIENRKGKIRAAENSGSGCMVLVGTIIAAVSAACWLVCLIV